MKCTHKTFSFLNLQKKSLPSMPRLGCRADFICCLDLLLHLTKKILAIVLCFDKKVSINSRVLLCCNDNDFFNTGNIQIVWFLPYAMTNVFCLQRLFAFLASFLQSYFAGFDQVNCRTGHFLLLTSPVSNVPYSPSIRVWQPCVDRLFGKFGYWFCCFCTCSLAFRRPLHQSISE